MNNVGENDKKRGMMPLFLLALIIDDFELFRCFQRYYANC
jgi:hypothetical protein